MLEKLGKKKPDLPPETLAALDDFKIEMTERVIPDIEKTMIERARLADDARRR